METERVAKIALLSNPDAFGSQLTLPELREYCVQHDEIFHYEVEKLEDIGTALEMIARVEPKILVINGGDGTVQTALTEMYRGDFFQNGVYETGASGRKQPPVAVLANGRTNLIANDLGAGGSPLTVLKQLVSLADENFDEHIIVRELIALTGNKTNDKPVVGMFLGAADLTEFILYCRHKIYPLGLPNSLSHVITAMVAIFSLFLGIKSKFLPRLSRPVRVSLLRQGELKGNFALLMVTTLDKLLFHARSVSGGKGSGRLRLMAIDQKSGAMLRFLYAISMGKLGKNEMDGIHIDQGDTIRIEGAPSNVILDGELFEASDVQPIILRATEPMPFVKLAA